MIQLLSSGRLKVIFEDEVNQRVGIGTETPFCHLHIYEQAPTASEILFRISTNAGIRFEVDEDGDCGIGGARSATARCTINDLRNGVVGVVDYNVLGGIRIRNTSVVAGTAAAFHFESDVSGSGQAGIYGTSLASNEMDIGFYTELPGGQGGRDERMRLTAAGNLGIGTATPSTKLEVAGAISCATITITASSDTLDVSGVNTVFINISADIVLGGLVGGVDGQAVNFAFIGNFVNHCRFEHAEGIGGSTQDFINHSSADEDIDHGGCIYLCNGTNWYDISHAKHV